jgi:hypothetical protein
MTNTADVTDGKPIAVLLQSISGVSAINALVAFYDIHGGKREVLFFYFVPDETNHRTNAMLTRVFNYYIIHVDQGFPKWSIWDPLGSTLVS